MEGSCVKIKLCTCTGKVQCIRIELDKSNQNVVFDIKKVFLDRNKYKKYKFKTFIWHDKTTDT